MRKTKAVFFFLYLSSFSIWAENEELAPPFSLGTPVVYRDDRIALKARPGHTYRFLEGPLQRNPLRSPHILILRGEGLEQYWVGGMARFRQASGERIDRYMDYGHYRLAEYDENERLLRYSEEFELKERDE